jgi:hypothetical protein
MSVVAAWVRGGDAAGSTVAGAMEHLRAEVAASGDVAWPSRR